MVSVSSHRVDLASTAYRCNTRAALVCAGLVPQAGLARGMGSDLEVRVLQARMVRDSGLYTGFPREFEGLDKSLVSDPSEQRRLAGPHS